jgi:hypothetical protein
MTRSLPSLFAAGALVIQATLMCRPLPATASNIFCGADASYVPWDAAANRPAPPGSPSQGAMRVVLYTGHASTASALVTFITKDAAYQATVAGVAMHETTPGADYASDPVLVTFPSPVEVQFAYVDSFSTNGAALTSCPSFVNQVDAYGARPRPNSAIPSLHAVVNPTMPKSYISVNATFLQKLPDLACGATYIPAKIGLMPAADAVTGLYGIDEGIMPGNSGGQAVVAIGIGSDNKPTTIQLVHSSGSSMTDQQALDQARSEDYVAARFLCTPVVSLMFTPFKPH